MCAIQFGVCAVLGGVGAIFEGLTFSQISGNLTGIYLYVGAISGAVGYTFQLAGQKYAEPALASLLMCLESVFGALGGWLIGGEVLRPLEYLGCALLLAGCVVAQLPQRKRPANFKNRPAWVGFFLPWAKINVIIRTNPLNFFKGVCKK